ncbi:MAG: hypothetical protein KF757_03995 [Phycisphaeraceae bacterium]|nr:hypothetical protein [Phycisphaeraceae bacterium]MCW5763163.1 hypothetical protein [Phycisphaeraceae bacterium]
MRIIITFVALASLANGAALSLAAPVPVPLPVQMLAPVPVRAPLPVDPEDRDASNPRNIRWAWPVIEWIGIGPRATVVELGAMPRPPETDEATITIVVRNAGASPAERLHIAGFDAMPDGGILPPLAAGERYEMTFTMPTAEIPYGTRIMLFEPGLSSAEQAPVLDVFDLHGPAAHRLGLVATAQSWIDGDERFGSMARRFRASLEDLHTLYAGQGVIGMPEHGGDPTRPAIPDRFRLEHIELFDDEAGRPALFDHHPDLDLVIAVNEGGPLCCFWLADGDHERHHSIGHNFLNTNFGAPRGIWSNWGEQALWHEIFHYRGVPDFYIYNIPEGALPGRSSTGWKLGQSPTTAYLTREIMNDTYTAPEISWLTATIAISKRGAARVGACENPEHEFGHMWRWVPGDLSVEVASETGAIEAVRIYRAVPGRGRDARVQRISEDAAPVYAAQGAKVTLDGDAMNAAARRAERSLWVLIEADRATDGGIETRWTILTLLEINEAYARGNKEAWTFAVRFEDMFEPR